MRLSRRTVAPMSLVPLVGVLTTLLLTAVPAAAAILVAVLTRGQARLLGVIGFGIFALEGLLGGAWLLLAPRLVRDTDVSVAVISGAYSGVRSLLAVLGLVLLAIAIVTAGRTGVGRPSDPSTAR
jgi:hypothetical protein